MRAFELNRQLLFARAQIHGTQRFLSLAGGGLYNLYLKALWSTVITQAQTYGLIYEYTFLLDSDHIKEIDVPSQKIEEKMKDVNKSDIIIIAISFATGQDYEGSFRIG